MKNRRIAASLDQLTLSDARRAAVLKNILARADAQRHMEQEAQPIEHIEENAAARRRGNATRTRARPGARLHRSLRWLAPAAAILIVLAALLSIPAASRAIRDWFYDMFRTDHYLTTPHGERVPDPDYESMLAPPDGLEQTNRVVLVNDSARYEAIRAGREQNGFSPYDPEDWRWLLDIEPTISDLYYDGFEFIVMTFLPCDPLPFMNGYIDGTLSTMNLDVLSLEDGAITNLETGDVQGLFPSSFGLHPQPDYYNDDGSANVENILADGGVWLYTQYSLPELAPGRYRAEISHNILDGEISDLNPVATVALLEQSFVLDTRKALASIHWQDLDEIAFSGRYTFSCLTFTDSSTIISRRQVALDGLSAVPAISYRPTAVRVWLDYRCPAEWPEDLARSVCEGIVYEVYLDGENTAEINLRLDRDGSYYADLPITETELKAHQSLWLSPKSSYYSQIEIAGEIHSLDEPAELPSGVGFYTCLLYTSPSPRD